MKVFTGVSKCPTVVLKQMRIFSPGDDWLYLETFLVVTASGGLLTFGGYRPRGDAKQPPMHRIIPETKNYPAPDVERAEMEKSWSTPS